MVEDDILVWPDNFWCYRKEYTGALAQEIDPYYRIVPKFSAEWREHTERATPKTS